jgi:hypothetical protein
MALRSLLLRPLQATLRPARSPFLPLLCRAFASQSTVPAVDPEVHAELNAQAELAARAKVLSPYHKVSFDERKVRIPWQDGKTSALYFPPIVCSIRVGRENGHVMNSC